MEKIDKIFIALIVLELILVIVMFLTPNECGGDPCSGKTHYDYYHNYDLNNFLNPFSPFYHLENPPSQEPPPICPAVCVPATNPLLYISVDLLVVTLVAYALYLAKRKISK